MDLAPAGTVYLTPFWYDTTCYLAAALMSVAALSNLAISPLDLNKELKTMEMGPKTKGQIVHFKIGAKRGNQLAS